MNDTKTTQEALSLFDNGYNCAQSVLLAYSKQLSTDRETVENLTAGFGSGMGKLQKTCGAMTGAFLAIGLHVGQITKDNNEKKSLSYDKIKDFHQQFTAKHQSSDCDTLLGCDLNTEEGQLRFKEKDLKNTVCAQCIASAIEILQKVL